MVIVPTLKKDTTTPQTSQTDVADLDIPTNPNSKMNLIVWNCRGSNNMEFRRQFRSLLDNYKPALVALLETRMHDHTVLKNDFNFSNLAQVEAQSMSRGMALLWNDDLVHVDELTITSQEIHCMVQVLPNPTQWLFSSIYAANTVQARSLLWDNLKCVYDSFRGSWLVGGILMRSLNKIKNMVVILSIIRE